MRFWQGRVAQWTRARGYGPRCRGFESLLARSYRDIVLETQNVASLSFFMYLYIFQGISILTATKSKAHRTG